MTISMASTLVHHAMPRLDANNEPSDAAEASLVFGLSIVHRDDDNTAAVHRN